jgi:glycosyltransferase involved in cell wall biosynthesis
MRIIFVINHIDFLLSHRIDICIAAVQEGYEVHVISPNNETITSVLKGMGIFFHELELSRSGTNPFLELKATFNLFKIFKKIKPDLVHLITIKPYLYGGIVARLTKVPAVVSAVAGLGILFSSTEPKFRLIRLCIYPLFKLAFGHKNQIVIFQNSTDRHILVDWKVLHAHKARIIRGSGVKLSSYPALPEPTNHPLVVSFASRLLKDKGVEVLANASRMLKYKKIDVVFWLIGEIDSGNVNSIAQQQLTDWEDEGLVKVLGFRSDIADLFGKSNIIVLPSFYGEGLPKVLIEAAACGRAIITTDHPGCRDAVEFDTGILVPIKDHVALSDAIQDLIQDSNKRQRMGVAGRRLAEQEFSVEKVVANHIQIYQELLSEV